MDPEDLNDDADLGAPIEELRLLDEVPSRGFVSRIRNRLRRRALSSQMVTLSWTGLATVMLEFFRMIFSLVEPDWGRANATTNSPSARNLSAGVTCRQRPVRSAPCSRTCRRIATW